jgi:hypothetical protein
MKEIVSIAVQFVPMVVVALLIARRDGYARKNILKYVGPALSASGAAIFVGVRFFGLAVYGKRSVIEGKAAETGALVMSAIGAAVFALHYIIVHGIPIVCRLFPAARRRRPAESREVNSSDERSVAREPTSCRCPKCGSLLGSRHVRTCPVCGSHVST